MRGQLLPALVTLAALATPASADMAAGLEAARRQDHRAAFAAFREEAVAGNPRAQAHLADMYRRGLGTPRSYSQAVKWYRRAAAQDDVNAQYNLAVHYREGLGVGADPDRASQWFAAAARRGHVLAALNLGVRYLNGDGLPRDPVLAYAWLTRAARQGNVLASRHRQRLAETLTPSERAQGEALARGPGVGEISR